MDLSTELELCPDHPVIKKPWLYDIREVRCVGRLGEDGFCIEIEMSAHESYVTLQFSGATEIRMSGELTGLAIRILDTGEYASTVSAPICVIKTNGNGRKREVGSGFGFWAQTVELTSLITGC